MKVGIQGTPGSYTQIAADQFFDDTDRQFVYLDTHFDVVMALENGEIDTGILAVENSLIGSIHITYDLLVRYDLKIIGETYLQIHHQLLGPLPIALHEITEVHSQSPALDQCRDFLTEKLPQAKIIEEKDTAYSAKVALVIKLADSPKGYIDQIDFT